MRVIVTGATGAVGRATVRELLDAGHEVSAFGAGSGRAEKLRALGVRPIDVDLYDAARMPEALADQDAVLHLATHIPPLERMRQRSAWAENERLRSVAAPLLVDAALKTNVRIFIQHSITFVYPDRGDAWIDERTEVDPSPGQRSMIVAEESAARFTASGRTGIALRNGLFYGATCASVKEALAMARWRISTTLGPGPAYYSSLHIDDAARATVRALAAPAGIYNVCDEPVTRAEYIDAFARAFRIKRPLPPPSWLIGALGGPDARMMMRSQRVSHRHFHEATGWAPLYPSVNEGFAQVAARACP